MPGYVRRGFARSLLASSTLGVILLTLPVRAQVPDVAAAPPSRTASYVAAALGVAAAAGAASVFTAVGLHQVPVQGTGRPEPYVTATGLVAALGVHFTLVHLLVPELTRLRGPGDVAGARARGWELSRWAWLAGALGATTTVIGAGVEQDAFGQGQGLMLTGLFTVFLSALVADALELFGAWQGATR